MTDKFLSTPSARRATFCGGSGGSGWPISIHALREEGDAYEPFHLREKIEISIHALREEGDLPFPQHTALAQYFYPRPPRGGRRLRRSARSGDPPISIHALREEGDGMNLTLGWCGTNFYPRPPRGGRQAVAWRHPTVKEFLSTPSARRATCCRSSPCSAVGNFYPRPPRGGRLVHPFSGAALFLFLSTPSARRATNAL